MVTLMSGRRQVVGVVDFQCAGFFFSSAVVEPGCSGRIVGSSVPMDLPAIIAGMHSTQGFMEQRNVTKILAEYRRIVSTYRESWDGKCFTCGGSDPNQGADSPREFKRMVGMDWPGILVAFNLAKDCRSLGRRNLTRLDFADLCCSCAVKYMTSFNAAHRMA